jgi:hypothetical protein
MKKWRVCVYCFWMVLILNLLACNNVSEEKRSASKPAALFVESSSGLPGSGQWRQGIAFCDVNMDGNPDILAPTPRKASEAYRVRPFFVWLGNGMGEWTFSLPNVSGNIDYAYGDVATGDFNADAIPDVALAMHVTAMSAFKGMGEDQFTLFSNGLPSSNEFTGRALVSADFNNDGFDDVAAAVEAPFKRATSLGMQGAAVCLGSQEGWRCSPIADRETVGGMYADQIVTGDVNGDGNADLGIASRQHIRDLIVWLGDGKGGFSPFNEGLPRKLHYPSVVFFDINQDGRDDLVASITGFGKDGVQGLKAFISEEKGFKEDSNGLPDKGVFTAVAAGDFNNDGCPDIVGGDGSGAIRVFTKKGAKWQELDTPDLPKGGLYRIYGVYLVDLNRDGFEDIVLNHAREKNDSGAIRVFLTVPTKKK